MCESSVYLLRDGNEELVMESVDLLKVDDDRIKVVSLFGEETVVRARIKSLSLLDHKIILEPLE
jgi:predicted RNA-binding protein